MKKILFYRFLATIFLASVFGCTTPYNYQAKGFEDVIVIQATITNQLKFQEIKLSRTYKLEESTPKFETEAVIYVTDDQGNKYDFNEEDDRYVSAQQFQASSDRQYQLHVLTKNGRSYLSTQEKLTTQTPIEDVKATAVTKNGTLGVEITANSFDPTSTSKYYRYEYEETSQIIAPKWTSTQAVANMFPAGSNPKGEIIFKNRTEEARECYSSQKSDAILLTNTSSLSEDRVTDFPLRFISSKDSYIRNRYSILVKQYVQSLASYTYYETLKNMSSTGSLLSQTQPGFFAGNIKSIDNPGEKVIGFFDVSSYSEKRIFFSFYQIFPKEKTPDYPYQCLEEKDITGTLVDSFFFNYCFADNPGCKGNEILDFIRFNSKVYYSNRGSLYFLYPVQCGDCSSFSSNIKPLFWID
jgi:hypothetical protein